MGTKPTSYRAEPQGAAIVCCLACAGDELVIDNKAVVEYGSVTPRREYSGSVRFRALTVRVTPSCVLFSLFSLSTGLGGSVVVVG